MAVQTGISPSAGAPDDDSIGTISKRLAGQVGAALFFLCGLVTVATLILPASAGINRAGVGAIGVVAIVVGCINWHLPWDRWPRMAALWFVPLAFTLIAVDNYFSSADPYRYGLFFIVSFTWIGLAYPRWTTLPFLVPFVAAYLTPMAVSHHASLASASSVVYMLPVCVLVGETVSWVSARLRHVHASLRQSEVRFRSLVQHGSDLIAMVGADGIIQYVGPSVERVIGQSSATLDHQSFFQLIHADDLPRARAYLAECARVPGIMPPIELRCLRVDGGWAVIEAIATNLLEDPAVGSVVINARDVTERKRFENQLAHQAFHDPLTGLPNRALLLDRLGHALARTRRTSEAVALLFLDVDNFKVINDSLGHQVGDELLVNLAGRLSGCLRGVDTAARLGGDEFAILLEGLAEAGEAAEIATRIAATLEKPFVTNSQEHVVTVCIGIALAGARDNPEDLLRNADVAMYQAKSHGKNRNEVFDPTMFASARARLALERDLRRAIDQHEFRLYYQPVLDLDSARVVEMEALLRWEHPMRGIVAPAEFVSVAEETGLILPLGWWVLEEACRQLASWRAEYAAAASLVISVNLSARQFRDPKLISRVSRALADVGLAPACLKLEITETLMMEDTEATLEMLRELRALGIRVAVDDFGTGYSSLSYLKRFPADALKIDRSFARGLGRNHEDNALVAAMIAAAKALNLQVTVEGVESTEQVAQLRMLACDRVQGFLFAQPLPSSAAAQLFERAKPAAELGAPAG